MTPEWGAGCSACQWGGDNYQSYSEALEAAEAHEQQTGHEPILVEEGWPADAHMEARK